MFQLRRVIPEPLRTFDHKRVLNSSSNYIQYLRTIVIMLQAAQVIISGVDYDPTRLHVNAHDIVVIRLLKMELLNFTGVTKFILEFKAET